MTDQKPRELLLYRTRSNHRLGGRDNWSVREGIQITTKPHANPQLVKERIHVVEHSAYYALKEENVKLRAENERLKQALSLARDKYAGTIYMRAYNPEVLKRYDAEIDKALRGADEQ